MTGGHRRSEARVDQAIWHRGDYLPSIFPYRGESWGTWSQVTYLNQRHFASAIGILLLVLVFLIVRYRAVPPKRAKIRPSTDAIRPEPNAVPETATKPVSDDITQLEAFPESSKEEAASVSESEDASHSEAATERHYTIAPPQVEPAPAVQPKQ